MVLPWAVPPIGSTPCRIKKVDAKCQKGALVIMAKSTRSDEIIDILSKIPVNYPDASRQGIKSEILFFFRYKHLEIRPDLDEKTEKCYKK